MKKTLLFILIAFFIGLSGFWFGVKISSHYGNADTFTEIHLLDRKYERLMRQPSFQKMMKNLLVDSLRRIKRPFTDKKIDQVIGSIVYKTHLKNFIRKMIVDSNKYSIIVGPGDNKFVKDHYYLITQDSCYYMKPLKMIFDLKPKSTE
ncbi:MAG: hypothetical protein ABI203_07690 [Mucilaginibacter sp.]